MDLLPLLNFMHRQGASDLHLSTGVPPIVRVHGEMKRITAPPLTADQLLPMLHGIMGEPHRKEYEERLETDFSFSTDFARFRVNAFTQRHGPAPPPAGRRAGEGGGGVALAVAANHRPTGTSPVVTSTSLR